MYLISKEWDSFLIQEFNKSYMSNLSQFIKKERGYKTIYPSQENIFRAFKLTPFDKLKVIIVGQDPYHNGAADGLAFSTTQSNPSVKQILKHLELQEELGNIKFKVRTGDFTDWAEQGVLLLNRVLTVEKGKAGSHRGKGWETFTSNVITKLSQEKVGLVFMLWGNDAKSLLTERKPVPTINIRSHLVLTCEHPQAANYRGELWNTENCFIKANNYLENQGKTRIFW